MTLLLLWSCLGAGGGDGTTAAAPAPPTAPGPAATPTAAAPAAAPAAATALPTDFRSCTQDSDCAVAWALAGLDHLPLPGETCVAECVLGVNRTALPAWSTAVAALASAVPCQLEMEPCPPLDQWAATCAQGTCQTRYIGAAR